MIGKIWSTILIRGILAVLTGLVALLMPGVTLISLILVFGFYAFIDGILAISVGFQNGNRSWYFILEGLLGMAFGVVAWIWPGPTALAFVFWIAAWAIVTGILEIGAAIRLRKIISDELMLILTGILSILFGVFAMIYPGEGGLAMVWMFGFYALFFGFLLIGLAFKMKKFAGTVNKNMVPRAA